MIGFDAAAALGRIDARAQDVLHAYAPGARAAHTDVEERTPPPEVTADPLSVAAPPNAYFVVQRHTGDCAYTRDGGFAFDGRRLVTRDGALVLGYPPGSARESVPVPLQVPAADAALGRCTDLRIESDGTLAYTRAAIDPRTRERSAERVVAGTLALARFPAGTQPVRIDAAHAGAPAGVPPHLGRPSDGAFAGLTTYARDTGAIDLDASLRRLSEAYLAFSALHAAERARSGTSKTAMDLVK